MIYLDRLLFEIDACAHCVTTNGLVNKDGRAIMGRGCALSAKRKYPGIDINLAKHIGKHGNVPGIIYNNPVIISLPSKHVWYGTGDVDLIENSLIKLVQLVDQHDFYYVALPKPGCSNGKLNYSQVKHICESILDDRFLMSTL